MSSQPSHMRTGTEDGAGQAREAAGEVAGTAREQARAVGSEAREQAQELTGELRHRLVREVDSQAHRTAGSLRQWADDLSGMAEGARQESPARDLASKAAGKTRELADTLENQGFEGAVEGVQSFARRQPALFLGGAALAGLVVGRMARSARAVHSDGSHGAHRSGPPPVPEFEPRPASGAAPPPAPSSPGVS